MAADFFIDLNADLGEDCGDDAAMLKIVTTANVAGGGHAGGGQTLIDTVAAAVANGVQVGAHPSYPDRENFGRTSHKSALTDDLAADVTAQIVAVDQAVAAHGKSLSHVKAHGALYNDAAVEPAVARFLLECVMRAELQLGLDRPLPLMGLPASVLQNECQQVDRPFWPEAFADRAYASEGLLVPRSEPGAVLGHTAALGQAIQIATEASVTAIDGRVIPLSAVTLCVHGDTPGAVALAQAIKSALREQGVEIRASS